MPYTRRLSRTCHFARLPTASSLRSYCRCLVRFTTLHALWRPVRAPCSGFSPPHRGVTSIVSNGSPLTPPSPHRLSHHARATMSSSSAEIAFPVLPVKRERLPRSETPSIETMPEDPRRPFELPPPAPTIPRFCHRGSSSDVPSPGAVSRFGLAPVHSRRRSGMSFSERDVVVRLLQHDTKYRLTAR